MDWSEIQTCAYGIEGGDLLHAAGVRTEKLDPALNWVPWIVLNGVFFVCVCNFCQLFLLKTMQHLPNYGVETGDRLRRVSLQFNSCVAKTRHRFVNFPPL